MWSYLKAKVFEEPQAIVIDGKFLGLTLAADGGWTADYHTLVLLYFGGDPLLP